MPAEETTEPPIAALAAAIRLASAPDAMRANFETWLRGHGVAGPDLSAMLAVGAERLLVYRMLVHNRMRNTIRDFIPRTAARLGSDRFRRLVDRFVDDSPPTTPYLRDVPQQFVAWAIPVLRQDREGPDYLADLARHELLHLDVRNDPRGGEGATGNAVALDKPLRFDGAARRVDYDYAIHKVSLDRSDRTEPEHAPTSLLVYRDETGRPRYLELTRFAAALIDRLLGGTALQPALVGACAQLAIALDDDTLGQSALLLADLAERKVMLGAV